MPTRPSRKQRSRAAARPRERVPLLSRLFGSHRREHADDLLTGPIRGTLLGSDQLAKRARLLARSQRSVVRRIHRSARLLSRLQGTERVLTAAHARLLSVFGENVDVGPAGEWLLDNFHVVQEHIAEVNESLPKGFYRELPELSRGALVGYPRVYELAISLISHSEGRIDLENVDLFVSAYQEVSQLSIGELWAIPAMLRLGLIESVRRMALRTMQRIDEVEEADEWAHRIQHANEEGQAELGEMLRTFVGSSRTLTPTFVSRFLTKLRLARGSFPPLVWLESWMDDEGLSAEEASARSTQRSAMTQIVMANSITSLRAIARRDWRTFVERQSVMEQVLRQDPAGFYAEQTFATRDHYRHVVESIAKRRRLSEFDVANVVLDMARDASKAHGVEARDAHVGYFLVDRGLSELEEATDYLPTIGDRLVRIMRHHPNVVFLGGMVAGTAAALAALVWLAGPAAWISLPLVLLIALIPANDLAVHALNDVLTALLPPSILPKLDLQKHGIPAHARTVVVVPTLFGSVAAVEEGLEHLEVQFLANRREHLHFAVLSDFTDAAEESLEGDAAIVEAAEEGVRELNRRYAATTEDAFYLFHRKRLWNPVQGVWMGWERKRGKLAEFNRFLQSRDPSAFSNVVGDTTVLGDVRYVITLDSDTALPPNAATALIGTIAHPLNKIAYDAAGRDIVAGFGIIQPRVGVSLPSAYRSMFAAIHSGHPGVDPYTTAVSDVYQDLYGEGSFTGKGIYDVDAFERATRGRFPENTLLSHDLIEGNYARVGLATDITLYDEYPSRYLTYTRRKHRWIRGDWQLLRWLTGHVPGPEGIEPNRLSPLSRWKLFDNLRRSTVEIAQLVLLVAGWTVFPGSPLRWTLLGLGGIAAPWIGSLLLALVRPPLDKSWRAYYAAVGQDAVTSAQQLAQAVAFLPHQAYVSADAIVRTLYRLFVSHRNLLEWQTASQTERSASGSGREVWRTMWPAVALPLLLLVVTGVGAAWQAGLLSDGFTLSTLPPEARLRLWQLLFAVVPLVLLWLGSPAIALALSAPASYDERRLAAGDRNAAMRYALLHWRFFDLYTGAATNWLAPDNVQDSPSLEVAMRTSPTNVGLQLLSIVSAYELGLLTLDGMTQRLELALRAMERMERHRGHFFNWYNLHDLRVLEPPYISTVDSGNLAGHLIALRQACLGKLDEPVLDARLWRALTASLALAQERLQLPAVLPPAVRSGAAAELHLAQEAVGRLANYSTRAGALTPARDAHTVEVLVEGVGRNLRRARLLIAEPPSVPEGRSATLEWIDWSLVLLDADAALVGQLRTADAPPVDRSTFASTTLRALSTDSPVAAQLVGRLQAIAERAYDYAMEMDFRFLFDETRELFSIGYQTTTHACDPSYYDLLASEARLASFVAIAKGDVPIDHWFRLGRTLTRASGEMSLVSWSGSMFEYLMPLLVMRSLPHTLLEQTYRTSVRRQISFAEERDAPWGVSESAYNVRDRHMTYQYRAFGIPDLALKRGLGRDLVIAPYATLLAAMVDLRDALPNLARLERAGALGRFGFRDALDFTRPDPGRRFAVVQNYMAHHIGMSMVSLANVLLSRVWQRRFHADPLVQSAELLLHERVPRRLLLQEAQVVNPEEALPRPELERAAVRAIDTPHTAQPHVALLGSTPYTVMVSQSGGGYSQFEDIAVTRWRSDATRDDSGQFCYVRDVASGRQWSTTYQPTCADADWYHVLMASDRVTFHRADGPIETRTEIAIVAADSAEVRRVTVTNNGNSVREIELTSYGEIVLGPADADLAHPAFANLFVETEWHEWCTALTASRRPRASSEQPVYCVHVVDAVREMVGDVSYESDRARFVGRGHSTRDPHAMTVDGPLSGTTGAVLDPIFSLRVRIVLAPGQSVPVTFTTLVAPTRERAFELAGRYHDAHSGQRALDLTWTSTQIELRELNITPADAAVFQDIAGHLLFVDPRLRGLIEAQRASTESQPRLWACGISGDLPILLARIESAEGLPTLRQLFGAHRYLRRRGLKVDLVIVNEYPNTYLQELNDRITEVMFTASDSSVIDRPGGVFLRRRDLMSAADVLMLEATAHVVIRCDGRTLSAILASERGHDEIDDQEDTLELQPLRASGRSTPPSLSVVQRVRAHAGRRTSDEDHAELAVQPPSPTPALKRRPQLTNGSAAEPRLFDNGFGGLNADGDYEMSIIGDRLPPAPWVNVIANEEGGCIVSETGAGTTWAGNSYFYRLTPWHNDPVSDPSSDVLYLRDEATLEVWSATPAPVFRGDAFTVTHGAGTSSFVTEHAGIASRLTVGIAPHSAVKLSLLSVTNRGTQPRRLSVTAFVEWTLGVLRERGQHHVRTTFDRSASAILARNHFDPQFTDWVAFLSISEPVTGYTGDRRAFIGRNGSLRAPAGLQKEPLGKSTGVGFDPCGALQCVLELAPGETRELVVQLGAAASESEARVLAARHHTVADATAAIHATTDAWMTRLSVITVETPEPSFDAMVNRWTLYQALGCRMWARSALYQSSGAYGFRDQLQDVMAFVYAEPAIARAHILRASARQFVEGDVQHWWHPQSGRGVRTRFSDDLAWLPYVVDHYLQVTGDLTLLDEYVPFLTMRALGPDEHEVYDLPNVTEELGSVYEHCLRALRRACTTGVHGLPLIGTGDWNDGMNRVGVLGRGESVWLAWFLIRTLRDFAEWAAARGDDDVATDFRARATAYVSAVETHGWDGAWYRRAYFDDGTPLGSSTSDECRIDSIAQSWSVISGAGAADRQAQAMASFEEHLVREDARLLMLLTPPFDKTPNDPGYIKGYLPGVRENGAQYTHAALWAVRATARRGDGARAFALYQMLNPLTHAATPEAVARYKVEPYVVAADVYTATAQLGRGGWTWYTGSASWMYRVAVESLLGFTKRGDRLTIDPCIPPTWPAFTIAYHHGNTPYVIRVRNPDGVECGVASVQVDGSPTADFAISLVDDGVEHAVEIVMGAVQVAE
ncbi:MAG: glucoamylase family protein, partial [Gemmatimonadota bacterium]